MTSIKCACDAEVGHLHVAVVAHENVGGLDVAVHHVVAVCIGKGASDVASHHGGIASGETSLLAKNGGQGAALHVLHCHEIGIAGLAPVVDGHDVGVVQASHGLGLAAEALDEVGVDGVLGEENLEGDFAVEEEVASQENVCHATTADTGAEFIAVVDNRGVLVRHKAF